MQVQRISTLTCPSCGKSTTAEMPEDVCDYFWECPECHEILRPRAGDCCVWCSYGTVPCPPMQKGEACC